MTVHGLGTSARHVDNGTPTVHGSVFGQDIEERLSALVFLVTHSGETMLSRPRPSEIVEYFQDRFLLMSDHRASVLLKVLYKLEARSPRATFGPSLGQHSKMTAFLMPSKSVQAASSKAT